MANAPTHNLIVERCWTLIGRRQGRLWHGRRMCPTEGEPASVAFDAHWVIGREESQGDVIGFHHTHPSGKPTPSERDHRTMRAWVGSLGKPLLCLIEADGNVQAYQYFDDQSVGVVATACELLPRGIVVAYDASEVNDSEVNDGE